MHRLILCSSVYQQSADHPAFEHCQSIDPDNQHFWRWSPQRLEAEVIRDSVLSVSGALNPLMGGPGYLPDIDAEMLKGADVWFEPAAAEEQNRRTVYMWQQRSLVLPFVKVFDGPKMDESCAAREMTTVTPQVFALFNSKFVHEKSRRLAERVVREVGHDRAKQVERAFQFALTRDPTPSERSAGIAFLSPPATSPGPQVDLAARSSGPNESESAGDRVPEGSLSDLCLALFNLNEFVYAE